MPLLSGRLLAALVAVLLLVFSGVAFADDDDEDDNGGPSKPAVVILAADQLAATGARAHGEIDARDRATTYFFEYGPTAAYGLRTPSQTLSAAVAWRAVSARLEGLSPGTEYHYRLVASNSRGTSASEDRTFTTLASSSGDAPPAQEEPADGPTGNAGPAPEPKVATTVAVEPGGDRVRVRRPGSSDFARLTAGSELPVGSEVDARRGAIALTAALPSGETQTGRFGGGRFLIRQRKGGLVDLHLRGRACPRRAARPRAQGSAIANAARRKRSRRSKRRLWGRDKGGRFRTHGKHSHATVRGTRWVVADRCNGTLTRVNEGSVVVRDKVRGKSVIVRVGERYLAHARR